MAGRKLDWAVRPPEGTGWKQQGSCGCKSGERCLETSICDGGSTGKCGRPTQQGPVEPENTTPAADGTVPLGTNVQPSVDVKATARSFTCGHAGALHAQLRPGCDMRVLAQECNDLPWEKLERWLPPTFASLQHYAGARNQKNMMVLLHTILSGIQIVQAALCIADGAGARWDEETACWEWSQHHVNESFEQRTMLFAWHCVAARAEELERRWSMAKPRMLIIANQLRDRLGCVLVPKGVAHPDIEIKLQARASDAGRAMIFTRIELSQFQRRATLALPAAIGLHRVLTGALVGRTSQDGQWLYDETRGSGPCAVYELPDWQGEEPVLVYVRNEKVVGVNNPKGFQHQKPRKPPLQSNFMPPQINWKRRRDGDKKTTAQSEADAEFPTAVKEIPAFYVTRVAARASTWVQRLPDIGLAAK
eukprot:3672842-Rhodomonas_salina.2